MNMDVHENPIPSCFTFGKSIATYLSLVSDLLNEVSDWLVRVGVTKEKITNIQIALAEALNNVVEHGFVKDGDGTVDIKITVFAEKTVVQVIDNGKEFSPPKIPEPPLLDQNDFDNLPEGGFGWFLINETTSSFELYRASNKNHLVLNF
jgi:serine/threonine-protein kinase RsbW